MLTSNFDIVIAVILMLFSLIGLVRGFFKEISSIINWFGSFYLTSKFKPLIKPLFEDKIQIPFLLDMVVNIVVFVGLIIILSIITNYLSVILKKLIPSSLNGTLGFLLGLLKGALLSLLIIAFMKTVYDKNTPKYLENSVVYTSISSDDIFVDMLNNIFGDFAKEKTEKEINDKINKVKKDIVENISDNLEKKVNDVIDTTKENIKNNIEDIDIVNDISKGIEDVNNDIKKSINSVFDDTIDKTDDLLDTKELDRLINIINE